jgi:hypothetical protein
MRTITLAAGCDRYLLTGLATVAYALSNNELA